MLTRYGQEFNEEELRDAAKEYIPLYGRKIKGVCTVPFKDMEQGGKVFYLKFQWMAGNWVFLDILDKAIE